MPLTWIRTSDPRVPQADSLTTEQNWRGLSFPSLMLNLDFLHQCSLEKLNDHIKDLDRDQFRQHNILAEF